MIFTFACYFLRAATHICYFISSQCVCVCISIYFFLLYSFACWLLLFAVRIYTENRTIIQKLNDSSVAQGLNSGGKTRLKMNTHMLLIAPYPDWLKSQFNIYDACTHVLSSQFIRLYGTHTIERIILYSLSLYLSLHIYYI